VKTWLAVFTLALTGVAHADPLLVGHGPPQWPADPRMIIHDTEIQAKLAQIRADVAAGRMYSGEPMLLQGPFRATLEWRNVAQNGINQHQQDYEIFVVIAGSGAMRLGGTLVHAKTAHSFPWESATLTATSVEGATDYDVHPGDMILIPPGTPHTVSRVDGELALWSMHLPLDPRTTVPSDRAGYAHYLRTHPKAEPHLPPGETRP